MNDNTNLEALLDYDNECKIALLENPNCTIYDGNDFDEGTKILSYIQKHGIKTYIKKYGKASQQVYEKLGLEYPGDPIYDPSLP